MNRIRRRQDGDRGPAYGLTVARAAVIVAALAVPTTGHSDDYIQEMTQAMLDAVGADTLLLDKTDDQGNRVTYLNPSLYKDVVGIMDDTPIAFPIPAKEIVGVLGPHGPDQRIYIVYENSPAKVIKCKWVGSDYVCYSS